MEGTGEAHHDLLEVQKLCRWHRLSLMGGAVAGVFGLGWDVEDVIGCIDALRPGDFHKSDPSTVIEGRVLDVYRPTYLNKRLYVKLDLQYGKVWIWSFKAR